MLWSEEVEALGGGEVRDEALLNVASLLHQGLGSSLTFQS